VKPYLKARLTALVVVLAVLAGCGGSKQAVQTPEAKQFGLTRCGAVFEPISQLSCYVEHFDAIRTNEGAVIAVDELIAWHNDPRGAAFSTHCHETLHELGVREMREAGDETDRVAVFTGARTTCTGGYVHGALTEYFSEITVEQLDAQYTTMCSTLVDAVSSQLGRDADATGWLSWNCNHMVGHALYTAHTEDLVAGAAMCARFEGDGDQRRGCEAGFYMEHYLVVGRSPGTGYSASPGSVHDVHSLCRDVDPGVRRGCWSESGGVLYITAGRDWSAAGEGCRTEARDAMELEACYESLGRNIAPYAGYEPDQMRTWCNELGDQLAVETCAIQIAGSQAMELDREEAGLALCREMVKDADRLKRCTDGVSRTTDQLANSGFDGGVGTWGQ
jgi:hypothetical protein